VADVGYMLQENLPNFPSCFN